MTRKEHFCEGWPLFRFYNLGLILAMDLQFYSSVTKRIKTKSWKLLKVVCTLGDVTSGNCRGGRHLAHS